MRKIDVFVNDVGARDGLQNQPVHVSPENRIALIDALLDAGLPGVEVASFVSPKAVPQMAGADEITQKFAHHDQDISALVPNQKGYELARAAGARIISVVPASSDTMNRKNINMGLEETMAVSCDILRQAKADGLVAQAYIATAIACPFEGYIGPEKIIPLAEQLSEAGAELLIMADTIGAANPAQIRDLFSALLTQFPAEKCAAHFHDTRAMALANVYAALELGVRRFDASVGGLGGCPFAPGAAGNLATEDLVAMLHQMGLSTGIDLEKLLAVADLAGRFVERPIGGRMKAWLDVNLDKIQITQTAAQ